MFMSFIFIYLYLCLMFVFYVYICVLYLSVISVFCVYIFYAGVFNVYYVYTVYYVYEVYIITVDAVKHRFIFTFITEQKHILTFLNCNLNNKDTITCIKCYIICRLALIPTIFVPHMLSVLVWANFYLTSCTNFNFFKLLQFQILTNSLFNHLVIVLNQYRGF